MDPTDELTAQLLGRCTFPAANTVAVAAVSGGADSMALLYLAVAAGLVVEAVHVDHGLRPGGTAEADLVRSTARMLGARFRAERIDIRGTGNLEERARNERRRVIGPGAMTGHTADDQAETVLLQLLRGAGPRGIGAMAPGPSKPMLGLRRHETRVLCERVGLEVVEDPSNDDLRFRRNAIRHRVVPLLNEVGDRDVVPLLCRTAAAVREAEEALGAAAPAGDVEDTRWLQDQAPALARRLVRDWLAAETGRPIDAAATDRVMEVVRHERRACEIAGGWRLSRGAGRLRLSPAIE